VHRNDPARRRGRRQSSGREILAGVPSERVDIARRGFAAFNRGEFDALGELLHDDVVAVVPDTVANSGVYEGHEGFARMLAHWVEPWEELRVDVLELIEEGDAVLAPAVQYGRGRGSGVEISMRIVFLLGFRGDRVAFYRLCEDLEEAREHARDI
jgi:ketosteroid isomerase-like protein